MGQKFRQNQSISLHFQDKQVFAFNAEIQDGHQKSDTLWVNSLLRFGDKHVFVFNAEIQVTQKFKKAAISGGKINFAIYTPAIG